jgi:hypothetical protein
VLGTCNDVMVVKQIMLTICKNNRQLHYYVCNVVREREIRNTFCSLKERDQWSRVLLEKLIVFPNFMEIKIYYNVYNSPPLFSVLSQLNPVYARHPTA